MENPKKMTFIKESGFIFAMLGSAVGFANILAFSAQCYRNGGGAFLIPFFAAVFNKWAADGQVFLAMNG